MTVHPLPIKRDSGDVAGMQPASAVPKGDPGWQRRHVLIRPTWVRAVVDPGVPDRGTASAVTERGELVGRDRRAA